MRVARIVEAATLLCVGITTVSAKVAHFLPHGSRHLERDLERAAFHAMKRDVERRAPQGTSTGTIPANPSDDTNSTIAQACMDTLSEITSVTNDADIAACYNILRMDMGTMTFTADLRLYVAGNPRGQFADVQPNDLMIGVKYPSSTVFSTSNFKRAVGLRPRQTSKPNMFELQQYTLQGTIASTIDNSKLNETQLTSLMIPQITINAVGPDGETPIQTKLGAADTAYFAMGQFQDQASSLAGQAQGKLSNVAADPTFAQAAIQSSTIFVLPGTTLGIFPTGMIVTLVWLFLFVVAYGAGTVGRINSRTFYRKRKMMVGARVGAKI